MYMTKEQCYSVIMNDFSNLNKSNKKAKRSCPLYGGQLVFA